MASIPCNRTHVFVIMHLSQKLRRVVVDQVGDSFLDTDMPLLLMMEAASEGDEARTEAYAEVFGQHADKLVQVSGIDEDDKKF